MITKANIERKMIDNLPLLKWVQVYLKRVFCLFLLCISSVLATPSTSIDLWPHVRVLDDSRKLLSAETVITLKSQFTDTKNIPYSNLGMRTGAVWMHISLDNKIDFDKDWVLTFGYPLLGLAEIYVFKDDVIVKRIEVGYSSKTIKNRPQSHNLDVPLSFGRGKHEILIRVTSEGSLLVPMKLTESNRDFQDMSRNSLIQGTYLGVMLGLIIYALGNIGTARKYKYFSYAGAALSMALFTFTLQGMSNEYFWGSVPFLAQHTVAAAHVLILSYLGFSLCFVESALNVKESAPFLFKTVYYIRNAAFIIVLLILLDLIPIRAAHLLAIGLSVFSLIIVLGMLWVSINENSKKLWFIFGGWVFYTIASFMLSAMFLGLVRYSPNIFDYFQLASLIEMLSWFLVLIIISREKYKEASQFKTEKVKLKNLAETDTLTGLPNRRALMNYMEHLAFKPTTRSMCAVLMMDLDNFKLVNDEYGHKVGDIILKMATNRLIQNIRSKDFICRMGGDEFVILINDIQDSDTAREISEKLIAAFSEPFVHLENKLNVGLTIGYSIIPTDGLNPETLIDLADEALYIGKKNGKGIATKATSKMAHSL